MPPAKASVQLFGAATGFWAMVSDRPTSRNSIPVVATTGCRRKTATRIPFRAPIPAATARMMGAARSQLPSPAGMRMATNRQLMKVARGPTEMSMPPARIEGVEANPTSTNGASVARVPGRRAGERKDGETIRFNTSSTSASRKAKAKGQRWNRGRTRFMYAPLISGRSMRRRWTRWKARNGGSRQTLIGRGRPRRGLRGQRVRRPRWRGPRRSCLRH